jgi:hypothetical protein
LPFGVEFGDGESKDLRLYFVIFAMNFRLTTLVVCSNLAESAKQMIVYVLKGHDFKSLP